MHIAGIIEREHVASTADRTLPQRTLLIQWKRKHGGDVFRFWITDLIMGWEPGKSARMRRRYQYLTGQMLQQTAAKVGELLWGTRAPGRRPMLKAPLLARARTLYQRSRLNVGIPERWSTAAWEFETNLYTDLPVRWHTTRRRGQEVEAQVRGTDKDAVTMAFAEACAQAADRAESPGKYGDVSDW
ncbi:hypothetical protein ACWGH2_15150 [Streptomyces sp. NPDC054871]